MCRCGCGVGAAESRMQEVKSTPWGRDGLITGSMREAGSDGAMGTYREGTSGSHREEAGPFKVALKPIVPWKRAWGEDSPGWGRLRALQAVQAFLTAVLGDWAGAPYGKGELEGTSLEAHRTSHCGSGKHGPLSDTDTGLLRRLSDHQTGIRLGQVTLCFSGTPPPALW